MGELKTSYSLPLLNNSAFLNTTRGLTVDTRINLIIGVFTIAIGILGCVLAWATWRLSGHRRLRRHGIWNMDTCKLALFYNVELPRDLAQIQ